MSFLARLAVLAFGIVLGISGGACRGSEIRVGDGIRCSVDPDEDPQRLCTRSRDFVCINTYSVGGTESYVCRIACDSVGECPYAGDVCCKGPIHGETYGKSGGCTPPRFCDNLPPGLDAGRADGPPRDGSPADAGPADGPAADGPAADAPSVDGLPADLPIPDGPAADGPAADGPAPDALAPEPDAEPETDA